MPGAVLWWIAGGLAAALGALAALAIGLPRYWSWRQRREARAAIGRFRFERERLELRFFELASKLGKPRGLRWVACDWLPETAFARDQQTGLFTAFVAVNIRFEAIAGGEMEDVAAVGNIRDAAAVFHFQAGHWGTGGRALFNMSPADAIERLQPQYLPVEIAAASSRITA